MRSALAILFVVFTWSALAEAPSKSGLDFDAAVKALSNSRPIEGGLNAVGFTQDPQLKAERMKAFNEQMAAIGVIQRTGKAVDLNVLLPYLGITTDPYYGSTLSLPTADVRVLRTRFPVWGVILDMPDAAKMLENYAIDDNDSLVYRMEAYLLLTYVDHSRTKPVGDLLRSKFITSSAKNNKQVLAFVDRVEKGIYCFYGSVGTDVGAQQ